MKANELRIGNLVAINNEKHHPQMKAIPLIVCGIEKIRSDESAKILLNYPKEQENIVIPAFSQFEKFVNPIELTEEWLIRFGFEKDAYEWSNYSKDKDDAIVLEQDRDDLYYSAGEGVKLSISLKYVHQLQNLYFALTGEELEITQK